MEFTYDHYKECLHPSEATSEFWLEERIYKDKKDKYDFVKELGMEPRVGNPMREVRIAEVGVRYGYSGYAFLSANEKAHYYGFDLISGNRRSGGVRGTDTFPWVQDHLTKKFGDRIHLTHINSQEVLRYPSKFLFDIFHVDANHGYNGCFHDCVTGLYSLVDNGILLVDDQDNGTVHKSTLGFIEMFKGNIKESYQRGTDYVIIKK